MGDVTCGAFAQLMARIGNEVYEDSELAALYHTVAHLLDQRGDEPLSKTVADMEVEEAQVPWNSEFVPEHGMGGLGYLHMVWEDTSDYQYVIHGVVDTEVKRL